MGLRDLAINDMVMEERGNRISLQLKIQELEERNYVLSEENKVLNINVQHYKNENTKLRNEAIRSQSLAETAIEDYKRINKEFKFWYNKNSPSIWGLIKERIKEKLNAINFIKR